MVRFVFQLISWCAGLPLTLLVIAALKRGPYKQYPVLFLYMVALFLLAVAGMPSYIGYYFQHEVGARVRMGEWFFYNELILDLLEYAVVISLIYVAASHVRSRRTVLIATIGGAAFIAGVSFLIHFSPTGQHLLWLTPWERDLDFSSEILDLGLWALLLSTRGRDPMLLLVTGGLGIQFTGDTIGDALRAIAGQNHSATISYISGFISTIAELTALYVFWHAFRRQKRDPSPQKEHSIHRSGA